MTDTTAGTRQILRGTTGDLHQLASAHPGQSDLYRDSDVPLDNTGTDTSDTTSNGIKTSIRKAAVLIPLLKQHDIWHVMYIRRTVNHDDRHSGQVAFPGGSQDLIDSSLVHTALRETREEIGIDEENIKILGTLTPYQTISYFNVTPVIGLISWPCPMHLQISEVARAFTIPLDWLRDENNFELRERTTSQRNDSRERRYPVVYFKEYDGEVLWGATARMTLNFLKALEERQLLLPG